VVMVAVGKGADLAEGMGLGEMVVVARVEGWVVATEEEVLVEEMVAGAMVVERVEERAVVEMAVETVVVATAVAKVAAAMEAEMEVVAKGVETEEVV